MNIRKLRESLEEDLDRDAGPEVTKERLKKALAVIERLAERELSGEDGTNPIYEVAHIARSPRCFESHEGWEEQFQELAEEFGLE